MPQINKTKYAILGMLSRKPISGYDIKKIIDNSIGYFWNENFGHIYPILKRMESEGLIVKQIKKSAGRPNRNVFTLTEQGADELRRWLGAPVAEQPIRHELLLKLFFGSRMPHDDALAMVAAEREKHEELLRRYHEIEALIARLKETRESPYWLFTLDYGKRNSAMVILWCDETMKKLGRMKKKRPHDDGPSSVALRERQGLSA